MHCLGKKENKGKMFVSGLAEIVSSLSASAKLIKHLQPSLAGYVAEVF